MKKLIFINFLITFLILLFFEFTIRVLNLSNLMGIDAGLMYQKNENHFMTPDSSGLIFGAKVYIDNNGYRVPSKSYKYEGSKNILFIGDSVTFGNGVLEEETFIGKLRKDFQKINFINTSVPGHQIKNYEKKINIFSEFKNLDKAFYIITLNDVYLSSNISNFYNEKISEQERQKNFWVRLRKINIIGKINTFLRDKSYLYMYIKGKFSDPSKRYYKNIDKFYKENSLSALSDLVDLLKKKLNTELYIITLPYEYQTRECKEQDLIPQNKIREIMNKKDEIKYFDLSFEFCNTNNPKKNFIKFDPMHLSLYGHDIVYKFLKDKI